MKTGQDIYDLFSQELDGETFDSDDDALRSMNVHYRTLLAARFWHILKKTATLSAGVTSLAGITDLDQVLTLWLNDGATVNDVTELKKARFDQRFDYNYDYYIDYANNQIKFIDPNNTFASYPIIVDYKYKPEDLELDSQIVFSDIAYPVISYDMILDYKEKDADPDFYNQIQVKREKAFNNLIDWDANLEEYA